MKPIPWDGPFHVPSAISLEEVHRELSRGGAASLKGRLGPAVLIGTTAEPACSPEQRWWFQTRPYLSVTPPAALEAGIGLEMSCWALRPRGLGSIWRNGLRIGRAPSNDVRIEDSSVSKLHARIVTRDGTATIEDAGSTSGTLVRGVALRPDQPAILRDLDEIQLGRVSLRYVQTLTLIRLLLDVPSVPARKAS